MGSSKAKSLIGFQVAFYFRSRLHYRRDYTRSVLLTSDMVKSVLKLMAAEGVVGVIVLNTSS